MERFRTQNRHKSSSLPSAKSCWWQLLSMNIPFISYLQPSWLRHTPIPCWGTPVPPPNVTTSLNLGVPLMSKTKAHRSWPWPLTCDPCHPHTSNLSPFLFAGWLAHYQVSVNKPPHTLTTLIYGDCGTCAQHGGGVGVGSVSSFNYIKFS